eukprot:gene8901-849_t
MSQKEHKKMILGYWRIRGLVSSIKFLLAILKVDFDQEVYEEKLVDGKWTKAEWFDLKPTLPFDIQNLPYLIDGDRMITQCTAIMRYISRKYGLVCKTEDQQIKVDVCEQEARDFCESWFQMVYDPKTDEKAKVEYFENIAPVYLTKFEKFLGNQKYLSGDSMSHADVFLFDLLDQLMCIYPKLLENHKSLQSFYKQFNEMEQVIEFRKDPKFVISPLNNPHASNYTSNITSNKPKYFRYLIGGVIVIETFSIGVCNLYHYLETKTKIVTKLSPLIRPLDLAVRFQAVGSRLLFIFLKHLYYKKYTPESDEEHLSELYKKNSESLLELINEYGGIYRKMGQELASMRNFLPDEYCDTLTQLFDKVPAQPFDSIKHIFVEDFGKTHEELFSEFDVDPIASASLAQVHRAVTKRGIEVAVKIQYPSVQYYYSGDILVNRAAEKIINFLNPDSQRDDLNEIRNSIRRELNFKDEAKNAIQVKENFKNETYVYIPNMYQDLSSNRILTMEFIHGVRGNDTKRMIKEGFSLKDVATKLFTAIAEQTFSHGFLHSDMHEGNFLVRKNPNNMKETQVVLIDHGLYDILNDEFRIEYSKFWKALILRDDVFVDQYCKKYHIQDQNLYKSLILMQVFDKVGPGPIEDFDQAQDGKNMANQAKELMIIFGNNYKKLEQIVVKMPLEMFFILRTSLLLRSVNQILGAPVNRFTIFARVAAKNCDINHDDSTWRGYFKGLKDQLIFDLNLKMIEFATWFSTLIVNLFGIKKFIQ